MVVARVFLIVFALLTIMHVYNYTAAKKLRSDSQEAGWDVGVERCEDLMKRTKRQIIWNFIFMLLYFILINL